MMNMQIAEYNETATAISILREKYGRQFDVTTTKGMTEAREARAVIKGYRVALEKVRQEIKAPALERTRLIDAEAKRITNELLAIEEPIDQAIKIEERRKEEEKAAKARAEAARVAAIAARMSEIRNRVAQVANQPSEIIRAALDQAQMLELSENEFQEFMPDAIKALDATRAELQTALEARLAYEAEAARLKAEREAEEARLKAEREELARLRQQDEDRKAEAKAKADAEAAAIRQAQAAEAARIAAAQRELDERQRKIDEEEKQQAQAAEAKKARDGRSKNASNPLEELALAVPAGLPIGSALKMAYDIGFEDGIKAAQPIT